MRSKSTSPGHLETMFNYGKALLESGKPGAARKIFSETVRRDPTYHEAFNELGLAHEALGKYREAEKAYLDCVRIKPDYAPVHRNLFMLYGQQLPDSDKAAYHLQRTLELDPDQPDADRFREFLRRYRRQKEGGR